MAQTLPFASQMWESINDFHTFTVQSPISIEDEDVAGKALLRLQQPKCAKISTLPGVAPHFIAIREMVKNSATDRRSMSMMEDAILDFDKLVSSMAQDRRP